MADETGDSASRRPHVLLAGGGSGGHVFPALAIGDELARRGWRVSFAGSAAGMERRLVEERGLDFVALAARPVVGRSLLGKLGAVATLAGSALRARRTIVARAVDVVVGTGGYVSAPAIVGAALARRPALLVEPNARAGAANRWLSRWAAGAAVAAQSATDDLRCPSFVAGVPVRSEFFAVPDLAPEASPRLLVLGGSQGARILNQLVPEAVARAVGELPTLRVLHQCGERNLESSRGAWGSSGVGERVQLVAFIGDVAAAMAEATLVLSRAGAITLAEICAAGRPSLLVPLGLAGGHQGDNARWLEQAGAACRLEENQTTAESLAAALVALLGDRTRLGRMAAAARALARPGAAAAIADRVEAVAGRAG